MVQMIGLDSIIVRKNNIIASQMDGETVMMNIDTGKYYNLGVSGGVIWNIIEESIKVEEIVTKLMEEYDVSRKQCEEEVLAFLNQIAQQGLIEVCS